MENKQLRKVTLVGATGNIGKHILDSLLALGHQVTVLTRPDSTAKLSHNVTVHRADYTDEALLADILQGQEVVIAALAHSAYDVQGPLFRAAAQAGVPWIVPCEFGSDPDAALAEHINLNGPKKQYRALVEDLGVSSWLGVVNNPWIDFLLPMPHGGGFGVDLKTRSAAFYDDGTAKVTFSTLRRTGQSLAALLALSDAELGRYRNRLVFFSSFRVSQRDIWESAMRVTGTGEEDWTVSSQPSAEVIRQCKQAAGFSLALLMALTFAEGMGGDYSDRVVDYEKLGLEQEESLDEVVREIKDAVLG